MECVVGSTREEKKTVQIKSYTHMYEINIVLWNIKLQRLQFYEAEKKMARDLFVH